MPLAGSEYLRRTPVYAVMRIASFLSILSLAFVILPSRGEAQPRRPRPPEAWVSIVNSVGLCLDVHGEDIGRENARIIVYPCHGRENQQWRFERGMLVSAVGGCLDMLGGPRDGAPIGTRSCNGSPSQQWRLLPGGSLRSAVGRCLDVEGGAMSTAGARAVLWACHRGPTQRFRSAPLARQEPPPRRPPVVVGPQAMDRASFDTLLARVRAASFSSDRIAVVGDAADSWFTAAQIATLVGEMTFSAERIRVVEMLAPRLIDRQNAHLIIDAMTFSGERDEVRTILARYR